MSLANAKRATNLAATARSKCLLAIFSVLLATAIASLEISCSAPEPTIDDQVAIQQITAKYLADQCNEFFTVGPVSIMDKKFTPNAVVISYRIQLAKTEAYEEKIHYRNIHDLGFCTNEFDFGKFQNLSRFFDNNPVGVSVNFGDTATFEKWQSGWKLEQ